MTAPEIRPAGPADLEDLIQLMSELRQAMAAINPATVVATAEEARRLASAYLEGSCHLVLLGLGKDGPQGFIRANLRTEDGLEPLPGRKPPWREVLKQALRHWRPGTKPSRRALYIADLYVRPGHRRRGLATALVEAVEERLAPANPDYAYLNALFRNQDGRAFWERLGYQPDSVVMTKRIPRPPEVVGGDRLNNQETGGQ